MRQELIEQHKGTPRVSMSNELNRSAHQLSLNEKRIIALCMSKMDSRATISEDKRRVRIRVQDFMRFFGLSTNHRIYSNMKKSCSDLMDRKLTLYSRSKEGVRKAIEFRWVDEAIYTEGEGVIELKFSQRVAPHLLELSSSFTSYYLAQATGLRSVASWRLLELLMQFMDKGWLHLSIDELHHAMDAPASSRERFSNFNKSILKPAIAELKKQEAMQIDMKLIKEGRKVTAVHFTFSISQQGQLEI